MGLEDIALMKSLPNMAVIQPADAEETRQAVEFLTKSHKGPAYLRLTRQGVEDVSDKVPNYKFEFGKGVLHREGEDLAIIATGAVLQESLRAAEMLVQSGINARVVNIHTIKPIDEEIIIESAKKCSKVVTVEDHQISGGFGETVNSVLCRNYPTKTFNIAVNDVFGESGSPADLYKKYKLDAEGIREQILNWANSN
jgi:transketolase